MQRATRHWTSAGNQNRHPLFQRSDPPKRTPGADVTRPIWYTCSPSPLSMAPSSVARSAATTRTMPMPQFIVRNSSASEIPPVAASQPNTGGNRQASSSISHPCPAGKIRGRFSLNPPPVIWANACTPPALIAAKAAVTYSRVGTSNAWPSAPPPNGHSASHSSPESSVILRTIEKPFECNPSEPSPISTSPSATPAGRAEPRSSAPTANPARSKAPARYIPGISAVSPPTSAQPACVQPFAMPWMMRAA